MADCKAILFDMNDGGFVSSLGKKYGQACQVDYIEMIENRVILIELKDLKEQLKNKTSKDILNNLGKKYTKSIEIIQNAVPILYYVVVKNDTEIVVWDNLFSIKDIKIKFENTSFEICETNKICEKLSTLNTRLCQE
ncbi:hypothetical protein AZO1586I_811 [Bathymodiolus thermophilus thioautotrophic gill symbiont]|uniref:Uncharacterized protein n=3 Tax=Gammaproteobacteria incertae sedis TaxID=118884 RepID=A0A1H6KWR0_9GAMM|nr:hypothetical protein AZO1586I_811 [Bathymodiolus thermophilus thioautotrophic gill symbiont]SEH78350.1 hypothetical protein BAZSYMA_ACONTIG00202_3 [Bathymodiolus azoricus thioautotrophic gill symbiont]VVH59516.1 hypothetical protein BAZOLSSOX_188 [uncultured Gammaproteobacteria bacterium]